MNLPLFLLHSVLFPGGVLPIHVFENRYRQMIERCLRDEAPFGVLLIREGQEVGGPAVPFEVGTRAQVAQVHRLEDGRMDIVCLGDSRFRLLGPHSPTPSPSGDVELLCSRVQDPLEADELTHKAFSLAEDYYKLSLALTNEWARTLDIPREPDSLSDFIAGQLDISAMAKQRLLEELVVERRLAAEIGLLEEALERMRYKVEASRAAKWLSLGALN